MDVKHVDLAFNRGHFSWKNYSPFYLPALLDQNVEETICILKKILEKHTLYSIYVPTLPVDVYVKMIDEYLTKVGDRKDHATKAINNSIPIRSDLKYCNECLSDQVKANGFYWFKIQWCFTEITECTIHQKKLKILRCCHCGYKLHKPVNMVKSLFNAECSFCQASMFGDDSFEYLKVIEKHWKPKNISDYQLFNKKYPVFSEKLIRSTLNYIIKRYGKKLVHKSSQSALGQIIYDPVDRMKINNFLKGKTHYVPKDLFWRCIAATFKSLNKFDKYLEKYALIETVTAMDIIPNISHNFKFKMYVENI